VYNENLKITSYHAGHVAGGCVFNIEIGASSLLYVNGFNLTGGRILLPSDIPRLFPSLLITNSAYAVAVSETRTVMEREFMKAVLECVQAQGKIVIPIYRLGFFYEIVNILFDFWKQMQFKYPIYVSDENMEYPSRFSPLLRHSYTPSYQKTLLEYFNNNYPRETIRNTKETPKLELFDWNLLQNQGPFVLFTGPATISQGDSFRAVKAVASDPKNLIVLSEACTPGNINYILYADPQRKEISKRLGVEVACGVHYLPCGDEVDAKSIVQLAQQVAPRQVVLDHVLKEDLEFMTEHIGAQLKTNQELDQPVRIVQIKSQPGALTVLKPPVDIPVRIHKSMFNHPKDVKGILIAENRRKLMLVTESNAVRRLKKKKHTLSFEIAWKQTKEPVRKKKRNSRAASSMSFLLAEPATSDDDEVQEEQPQADVHQVLEVLEVALRKWLVDVPIERRPDMSTCLILKSVLVSITADWQVLMEWTFEDEELAGRVLGIAKQIVEKEYSKKTES
jgi:integrator complex subunit 11